MEQTVERYAIPFTFLFKRERHMWTALACEVDIAACGHGVDEARDALKEALEIYVVSMFQRGRRAEIARPISQDDLREFSVDPAPDEPIAREYHTMIVTALPPAELAVDFIPALLPQTDCRSLEPQVH
jgi:hypothetical protein